MRVALPLALALAALQPLALHAQKALVEGREDSPVQVIVYEDLQCPDCAAFRRMMDEKLLHRYGSKVAFLHREFPLAKHSWARKAAIAARFFGSLKPEIGLAYRRQILNAIAETTDANFNQNLTRFAQSQGIPPETAVAALTQQRFADLVEKDYQEGVARGVSKTPTVFVDGQPFIETGTFEEIATAIDAALATAPQTNR
jgi:protein-disulfide isomerase